MENIYNYAKFIDVSRIKQAVYPLYFTGNIDVSTTVHRKPRKKYRPDHHPHKLVYRKETQYGYIIYSKIRLPNVFWQDSHFLQDSHHPVTTFCTVQEFDFQKFLQRTGIWLSNFITGYEFGAETTFKSLPRLISLELILVSIQNLFMGVATRRQKLLTMFVWFQSGKSLLWWQVQRIIHSMCKQ